MSNGITEGRDRELPPNRDGELLRAPTPAVAELKTEVLEASAFKDAGRSDSMRERSSIESRTDLRLAATNEALHANRALPQREESPRIDVSNVQDWLKESIESHRKMADRLGVTGDIERLSYERKTANQIAIELAPRLEPVRREAALSVDLVPSTPASAMNDFVRAVRTSMGVPGQDNRDDYNAWRVAYEARQLARDVAPPSLERDPALSALGASISPTARPAIDQETARRWVDLDASDFNRIRSDSRREDTLESIAGHARFSPEYAVELKKRSPILAEAAQTLNDERAKAERESAVPTIERNAAVLAQRDPSRTPTEAEKREERELARHDVTAMAALPQSVERHVVAAEIGENARTHPVYREEMQRIAPAIAREAEDAAAGRDEAREVQRRHAELAEVARDALPVARAREVVREDVAALSAITVEPFRSEAAAAIGETSRNQVAHRGELAIQAPNAAKEAQAAAVEGERRAAETARHLTTEYVAVQRAQADRAAGWPPAQAAEEARKDALAYSVADAPQRRDLVGDMAVAASNSKVYSEVLAKEAPEVSREVEGRRERDAAERFASEQRKADMGASAQSRASLIDAAALAAVANIRARETAKVVEQLASSPSTATPQLREAHETAQQASKEIGLRSGKEPALHGQPPAAQDPDLAAKQGQTIKRPVREDELSEALRTRFVLGTEKRGLLDKGSTEFVFRSGKEQGSVAFVDIGKSLNTEREDKATIRAMIEVANAKNWKEVTVSGTDTFRQAAWLEASLAGKSVRGYEPRDADKKLLVELQEQNKPNKAINTITGVEQEQKRAGPPDASRNQPEQVTPRRHIDGDALTRHEKSVLDNSRAILNTKALGATFTEATLNQLESRLRGERVYVGELVDHGKAPYKFDKDKDDSYFVTLRNKNGEQVIWGKGLEEAMRDRNKGEQIVLQNVGKRDVTVQERIVDGQGKVIDLRPKDAQLNAWKSELLSRVGEKVRPEALDTAAPRQPSLGVYDAKAPRAPVQQDIAARTPGHQRNAEQQRNSRER